MSHDPYELLNSDDPEKVEEGLIILRTMAMMGYSKAENIFQLLKTAECPDDPADAAPWVIQNRIDVANEEAREKESGCAFLFVLTAGLTAAAMATLG
jgi:hypothetical protein